MSIRFDFQADASQVVAELGEIREQLAQVSWADFSMGAQAVIGLIGQISSAVVGLVSSLTAPAAALENMSVRLGVMLDSSEAGEDLAAALERLATNGVVELQELQTAAEALSGSFDSAGDIAEWVAVFADISAGSKIAASRLAEMTARLDDMGKAELTELSNAGIPIFQTLAEVTGKNRDELLKMAAAGELSRNVVLSAFRRMTEEGGKFYKLNQKLSDTTAGSWDTMAASWREIMAAAGKTFNEIIRPLLKWVSEALQKNKQMIAFMVKTIARFATIWAGIKIFSMAAGLAQCVTVLVQMIRAAKSFRTAMATSGGVITLISAALGAIGWELFDSLMYSSSDKQDEETLAAAEEAAERAKDAAERRQAEIDEEVESDAVVRAQKEEAAARLEATESLEDFEEVLREVKKQLADDFDVGKARAAAREREEKAAAAKMWQQLVQNDQNRKAQDAKVGESRKVEIFSKLGKDEQKQYILEHLIRWGASGDWGSAAGLRDSLGAVMSRAAEAGMTAEYAKMEALLPYIDAFGKAESLREQQADELAESLRGWDAEHERARLLLRGDEQALAAFDMEQALQKYKNELLSLGLSEDEADYYAHRRVKDERAARDAAAVNASTPSFITSSSAAIGGGGFGIRLGDAQLEVSKKHLAVGEQVRDLVQAIGRKITGFAGIPVTA